MKKDKSLCNGCYNQEYHHGLGGAKECWNYKSAEIILRIPMSINEMPPYDKKRANKMMSCYRRSQMAYPSPDALDDKGYWKS